MLGAGAIFGASDSSFTWARGSGLRRLLRTKKRSAPWPRTLGEQGTEGCSPRCRGLRPRRRCTARCFARGFWTVSQEAGADFAVGLGLLGGFRRRSFAAGFSARNAGAERRFGLIRPANPPRSCKRGLLVLRVAHLNVCFGFAGDGHRHCDCCAVCVDARARMGGQKGIRGSLGERSSWARRL